MCQIRVIGIVREIYVKTVLLLKWNPNYRQALCSLQSGVMYNDEEMCFISLSLCVCVYVSFISIGCIYHEYDRWTGDVDIKRQRRHFFTDLDSQWPNSWRSKVWAGVRNVAALQVKCLCVYGWVWLSCQLATCITNTTYTLGTERCFWYQQAKRVFCRHSTWNLRIGVCVCVW